MTRVSQVEGKDRFGTQGDGFFVARIAGAGEPVSSEFESLGSESFEVVLLVDGAGSYEIDLMEHPFEGPVLFALAPGQIRKLEITSPADGWLVRFHPSIFSYEKEFFDFVIDTCLFDAASMCPVINVPATHLAILTDLFVQMNDEAELSESDSAVVVSSYIKILVAQVNRLKRQKLADSVPLNDPSYVLFRKFRIELEKRFREEHSPAEFARSLGTDPRTLNGISNRFAGAPAGKLIRDRIILEARRSLVNEPVTIKELSYSLGFDDPAYFTRFFKKHTGEAPNHFRERLNGPSSA